MEKISYIFVGMAIQTLVSIGLKIVYVKIVTIEMDLVMGMMYVGIALISFFVYLLLKKVEKE
jgi:hypothetical protein